MDHLSAELVPFVLHHSPFLLVHAFDTEMVAILSRGRLKALDEIDGGDSAYMIVNDSSMSVRRFQDYS
jgi:hypothetical protein